LKANTNPPPRGGRDLRSFGREVKVKESVSRKGYRLLVLRSEIGKGLLGGACGGPKKGEVGRGEVSLETGLEAGSMGKR